MSKFKIVSLLPVILTLLFLSCWNTSPTSDKTKSFTVGGSVIDKDGTGIEGISVQISGTNFSADDTTDSEGTFKFKGISSGSYNIKTSAENRVFKPSGIDVTVSDSDIDLIKFIAVENRVHGQVIDIITNKGIKNLKMFIQGNADNVKDSTYTDIYGEYEFFDLNRDITYYINTDYYLWDRMKNGNSYPPAIDLLPKEFTNPDTTVQTLYMSSEVLQIKTATYSKETNTVYLEWTTSKSNFCVDYTVLRTDKLPLGTSTNTGGDKYQTNYAYIEITPKYLATLKGSKIIHYAVSANYDLDPKTHWTFSGPYSEPVTFNLAE